MTVRLLGVGAAAPALRLAAADVGAAWGRSGRGQAAVCAPDEDMLTLAWDAATRALAAAGIEPDRVDALCWGTSRPPFAEGPSLAFLAAALGCSSAIGGVLCAGSAHAGMEALATAADAIAAGSARHRARRSERRGTTRPRHRFRGAVRRGCGRVRAGRGRRHSCTRHTRIAYATVPRSLPRRRRAGQP